MAVNTNQIIISRLSITLLLLCSIVSAIPWDKTCHTDINWDTNLKRVVYGDLSISTPREVVCEWRNPKHKWKHCEVIVEIENSGDADFRLPASSIKHIFKHPVEGMKVSYSKDYVNYTERILNQTCFRNLTDEESIRFHESNECRCYYNITKKRFYNWRRGFNVRSIPKHSVVGVRMEFKTPIIVRYGRYLDNQFNFTLKSLQGDIVLDPDISACSVLSMPGATYTMAADIIDSTTKDCISITADDVTLDCQGHIVDGTLVVNIDHGIMIGGDALPVEDVTIKNCVVREWYDANIMAKNAEGLQVTNLLTYNGRVGIEVDYCDSIHIHNITAKYNDDLGIMVNGGDGVLSDITTSHGQMGVVLLQTQSLNVSNVVSVSNSQYGFYLHTITSNLLSNLTIEDNSIYGIYFILSSSNTIKDSRIQNNGGYGIYLLYTGFTGTNMIYNNVFNNTDNHFFVNPYANHWNTEKHSGTNIVGGPYIGGNYWTNPSGTGYSDTCIDSEGDGFCDNPYTLASDNVDYLPLSSKYQPPDLPDLTLTWDDISFSPKTPREGEAVTITATIRNIGGVDAENVSIRFIDGDPENGTPIANQTIDVIPAGGNGTVSLEWTATLGSHNIYVVVDPRNTITEENEDNNQASEEIEVISPTFRVLVVATYYQDENLSDIKRHESNLSESLRDTTEYYLEQSYNHDYIWFSEPVYLQMPRDSEYYRDYSPLPGDDGYYTPTPGYALRLWKLIENNGYNPKTYDIVLNYQTDRAVIKHNKSGFRAVVYPPWATDILRCNPIALLNIEDDYDAFAHELGHALYGFKDFYSERFLIIEKNRGDINGWGLMGEVDIPPLPIISFNKVLAGWLDYVETEEAELIEPKTFKLKSLEDTGYGDDVVKIAGIKDPSISLYFSYDFILEARKRPYTSPGVVIYQDHHGVLRSFLENLPSHNPLAIHPKRWPTLEVDSNTFRHPVTGLRFQYLGDTNLDPERFEPEVIVGFNVSENANMTGVILNNLDILSFSNSTSGYFAPFLDGSWDKESRCNMIDGLGYFVQSKNKPKHGFELIRDVDASPPPYLIYRSYDFTNISPVDFMITHDGRFKGVFTNNLNVSIKINAISITNLIDFADCKITDPPMPIVVNTNQTMFVVQAENCTPLTAKLQGYGTDLEVRITYDTLFTDASVIKSNITEKGIIRAPYEPLSNRQSDSEKYFLGLIMIGFFITGLLIIYRNNRRIRYILIPLLVTILLIVLLFVLLWWMSPGSTVATYHLGYKHLPTCLKFR